MGHYSVFPSWCMDVQDRGNYVRLNMKQRRYVRGPGPAGQALASR